MDFSDFTGVGDKRKKSKEERRGIRSKDRAMECGIGKLCPPPMGKRTLGKKVKLVTVEPKEEVEQESHINPRMMGVQSELEKAKKKRTTQKSSGSY